jgi:hypothetical protein
MAKKRKYRPLLPDDPLYHADHARPVTRRDFIRQGMLTGTGLALGGGVFSMFANPRAAYAAVSDDLDTLAGSIGCQVGGLSGDVKIPFICFDLAGGANIAGSNVLVGTNRQDDLLSTAGYSRLGLPGDMIPGLDDSAFTLLNPSNGDFINSDLGLLFHADSAMLRGILDKFDPSSVSGAVDGCVIPARSDNDTGNNPHNPLYAIAASSGTYTGARGSVVDLIGSRSSTSGGNSMAPALFVDNELLPTKVDRPSDVTGMVDVGNLTGILNDPQDVTAVMESMARVSHRKMSVSTNDSGVTVSPSDVVKDLVRCGYIKAADIAERFAGVDVNPDDRNSTQTIVGDGGSSIFTTSEFDNDSEFRKAASVMKMVIDGYAGAGCVTMGGYDYHTGDRIVGENRDLRAGRCIGACLRYAAEMDQPLMLYVFSDGSLTSNGTIDNSLPSGGAELGGRGKGVWTGDNSSVAGSFFLVYDPNNGLSAFADNASADHRQIGFMDATANVVTGSHRGANNVNLLVNTVLLNYMALNGDMGSFNSIFTQLGTTHGLGTTLSDLNNLVAFNPIA